MSLFKKIINKFKAKKVEPKNCILLETTVICNLKCKFCYKNKDNFHFSENESYLSVSELKKIFNRKSPYKAVSLINKGEFFVHPDFLKIFEYVMFESYYSPFVQHVFINTNATLLTPEVTDKLFEIIKKYPVFFVVNFSINAFKGETYKYLTGKDLRDVVYYNTEYFMKKSSLNKSLEKDIKINVQAIILEENKNELSQFIDFWSEKFKKYNLDFFICEDTCDTGENHSIGFKRMYSGFKKESVLFLKVIQNLKKKYNIFINDDLETGQNFFKRKACNYLFNQPVIQDDFRTICCRDIYFKHKFPNSDPQKNLFDFYFKALHMLGFFEKISSCRDCFDYEFLKEEELHRINFDNKLKKMYFHRINTGIPFEFYFLKGETSNKKIIDNFLNKNNFYAFFSNLKLKRAYYFNLLELDKKLEKDFCIAWTGELKFKKNKLFTGCDDIDIEINDFKYFKSKLKQSDFSSIPEKCLECKKKYSYNSNQDRFRTFGLNCYHSPVDFAEFDRERWKIDEMIKKKDHNRIQKFLKEKNRFIYDEEYKRFKKLNSGI
ncbi:MAG: radical SAM protein [Candidatus Muiribacteriota bacterium]